jgi:hypothetical protein
MALRFLEGCRSELSGAAFAPARSLLVLDLSECSIQRLPDSIGQLKQLRYLSAPEIQDEFVPECITNLLNLIYLNLQGSNIRALPKSIGELKSLMHLDLSKCEGIQELPVSFRNLEKLAHLDLSNCWNITGVSESLQSFNRLEHLNISWCSIRKIDGGFYGGRRVFPRLEYFYLSHMECLEEWNAAYSSGENGLNELTFPKLECIMINRCPLLRFKACSPPGRKVHIDSSDQVVLSSWENRGHISASSPKAPRPRAEFESSSGRISGAVG